VTAPDEQLRQLESRLQKLEHEAAAPRRWFRWSVLAACLLIPAGAVAFDPFADFMSGQPIEAAEMNTRFGAIAGGIDDLEGSHATLGQRLSTLEAADSDTRLTALEGQDADTRLTSAESRLDAVEVPSKVQRKGLGVGVQDVGIIDNLTFSNLVEGRFYRITVSLLVETLVADQSWIVSISNGGTGLTELASINAQTGRKAALASIVFEATHADLILEATSVGSGVTLLVSSLSYAQLEELHNHQTTSDF